VGKALRRAEEARGVRRGAAARGIGRSLRAVIRRAFAVALACLIPWQLAAQDEIPPGARRYDAGRLTIIAYPSDDRLARSLLDFASKSDTFPGLPRPSRRAVIAIAPDDRRFREWVGPYAPEWGAAIAFPASGRIILQGSSAGSDAGDPLRVLRHELAHLALYEYMGDTPPRWFDEGYASYAAGEWDRDDVLAASFALALRRTPTLAKLDSGFTAGAMRADAAYALAHRAVAELAALDPDRGLTLFFRYWRDERRFDPAVRRAFGITGSEFEDRYRRNTRRRFGALALVTDLSLIGVVLTVLLIPLYVGRRRRDRLRLARMRDADEAAEKRAREESARAIEELLRTLPPASDEGR
jgi:hypothetical protein